MTPFIIDKGRMRLMVAEPHQAGSITMQLDDAALVMFLDAKELKRLSRQLWAVAVRLETSGR